MLSSCSGLTGLQLGTVMLAVRARRLLTIGLPRATAEVGIRSSTGEGMPLCNQKVRVSESWGGWELNSRPSRGVVDVPGAWCTRGG